MTATAAKVAKEKPTALVVAHNEWVVARCALGTETIHALRIYSQAWTGRWCWGLQPGRNRSEPFQSLGFSNMVSRSH